MTDTPNMPKLRLVADTDVRSGALREELDALAEEVLDALRPHLEGGLVPDDPALLRLLCPALPPEPLGPALDHLLARGRLRRLVVGTEPHLAFGQGAEGAPASGERDDAFELEVATDVEVERVVLWRVACVVLGLGALALTRELLLHALT
ncbi:MAG: hypothetical protein AAGH15_07140 [Myxococcota bacterium]